MQRPQLLSLLLFSTLALASCGDGGSDPRSLTTAGGEALARGDYTAAAKSFEKALDAIGNDASNPLYMDLEKGLLRAKAGSAPDEAVTALEALAEAHADKVDEAFYSAIAVEMSSAGKFDQAIAVIQSATTRFGKTELLSKQVAGIRKTMESAGAANALKALDGLGYTGGD